MGTITMTVAIVSTTATKAVMDHSKEEEVMDRSKEEEVTDEMMADMEPVGEGMENAGLEVGNTEVGMEEVRMNTVPGGKAEAMVEAAIKMNRLNTIDDMRATVATAVKEGGTAMNLQEDIMVEAAMVEVILLPLTKTRSCVMLNNMAIPATRICSRRPCRI